MPIVFFVVVGRIPIVLVGAEAIVLSTSLMTQKGFMARHSWLPALLGGNRETEMRTYRHEELQTTLPRRISIVAGRISIFWSEQTLAHPQGEDLWAHPLLRRPTNQTKEKDDD